MNNKTRNPNSSYDIGNLMYNGSFYKSRADGKLYIVAGGIPHKKNSEPRIVSKNSKRRNVSKLHTPRAK